jgi:hypothetical protein
MKFANATKFDRKSAVAEGRDLQFHATRNEGHLQNKGRDTCEVSRLLFC